MSTRHICHSVVPCIMHTFVPESSNKLYLVYLYTPAVSVLCALQVHASIEWIILSNSPVAPIRSQLACVYNRLCSQGPVVDLYVYITVALFALIIIKHLWYVRWDAQHNIPTDLRWVSEPPTDLWQRRQDSNRSALLESVRFYWHVHGTTLWQLYQDNVVCLSTRNNTGTTQLAHISTACNKRNTDFGASLQSCFQSLLRDRRTCDTGHPPLMRYCCMWREMRWCNTGLTASNRCCLEYQYKLDIPTYR
jgi:hypothetical protein